MRALACLLVVLAAAPAAAQPLPRRIPRDLAPLASACRAGELRACYDLGVHYQIGDGVRLDYRVARRLFEHACDGGDTYGCNGLGRLFENGHGVRRDPARAVALYERACEGGDWPVCYYLGWLHAGGHLVPVALDRARDSYRRSCAGGYADACTALELPPIVAPAELHARLARWLLDASAASVAAAQSRPRSARFEGDPSRDLRATQASTLGSDLAAEVVIWLFEESQLVSDVEYLRVQLMAFAFPDGRLRWAVNTERLGGRPTRAMVEMTRIDVAPPELRWTIANAFAAVTSGRCDLDFVAPADVARLPAPIQRDVATSEARRAESCRIAQPAQDDEWIPSSRFVTTIGTAGGRAVQVLTNLHVAEDGAVSLAPATVEPL